MAYSASISAQSHNSISSTRSRFSLRSLPTVWRRVILFLCPHLQPQIVEVREPSPQTSLDFRPPKRDDYLMSGAIPKDNLCESNQHRPPDFTSSCSPRFPQRHRRVLRDKFQQAPEQAAVDESNEKRISYLNIRPVIEAFTREVDTRFLSPTAEQVLRYLKRLSQNQETPTRVLVQLGTDAIWMTAEDADILFQLRHITQYLTSEEKNLLLDELAKVIEPQVRYPLQQVMMHGMHVKSTRMAESASSRDRESEMDQPNPLSERESEYEARHLLRPSPLVVRRVGPERFHQGTILSPLTELSEPTPRRFDENGKPHQPSRTQGSRTDQNDNRSETRRPDGASPMSFQRTRSGGDHDNRSAVPIQAREGNEIYSIVRESSPPSQRHSIFMNPRRAPTPPPKDIPTIPAQSVEGQPKRPGNVARAHAAALVALGGSEPPGSPNPSITSSRSDKRPGSVRDALVRLKSRPSGSVRSALENLDPSLIEDVRPADVSDCTHEVYAKRSSSLPRKPPYLPPKPNQAKVILNAKDLFDDHGEPIKKSELNTQRHITREAVSVKQSPARTWTAEDLHHRPQSRQGIIVSKHIEVDPKPSCLRGGAEGSDVDARQFQSKRRKVSTIFGRVNRLEDDERPPKALWWLACGRIGRRKRVPTAGELRERRVVEDANREIVGFLGTVIGLRAVRRMSVADPNAEDSDGDEEGEIAETKVVGKADKDGPAFGGEK